MRNNILALNPGTRYLGMAIFQDSRLRFWKIKALPGKWSDAKIQAVTTLISELIVPYRLNTLIIKKPHPSRSSPGLERLITGLETFAKRKKLKVMDLSLSQIKRALDLNRQSNKWNIAELVVSHYPFLVTELEKEKGHKNAYLIRMFEAIALGLACFNQIDK